MKITKDTYLKWYEDMLLWRKFEMKCSSLYIQQKIRGFLHLYIGQEGLLAGVMKAIDPKKDKFITAYRCHVHPIAMGAEPRFVMAELFGKETGISKGKGGSMHMFSKKHNFYGGFGIVGGQIPIGAGIAFADKYFKKDAVTLTFLGDGAVWQGTFHETLNMAAVLNLPVIFVIENNQYAMGTSMDRSTKQDDLSKIAISYNIKGENVDGTKPEEVAKVVFKAVENARKNNLPSIINVNTYRYKGHSMSDGQSYRTKQEIEKYKKQDSIDYVLKKIMDNNYVTKKQIEQIEENINKIVKEAVEFAENSKFPERKDLFNDVYSQENYPFLKN